MGKSDSLGIIVETDVENKIAIAVENFSNANVIKAISDAREIDENNIIHVTSCSNYGFFQIKGDNYGNLKNRNLMSDRFLIKVDYCSIIN